MSLKRLLPTSIVMICMCIPTANAQHTYHGYKADTIWVSDDIGSPTQMLIFANDSNATYGMDTISDRDSLFEIGGFPPLPSGLDARWVSIPSRPAASYIEVDHYHFDVRPWPTNAALEDTFKLKFISDPGANLTFKWHHTPIAESCDSCIFYYKYIDGNGNMHTQRINMAVGNTGDTARVTADDAFNGLSAIYIYKCGIKMACGFCQDPINSTESPKPLSPLTYALYENYPNPFNPQTTITYALPSASNVTLKIYDLLGQVVAVLKDQASESPGLKQIDWDAVGLSSGVYICRLEAINLPEVGHSFYAVKKMILVK